MMYTLIYRYEYKCTYTYNIWDIKHTIYTYYVPYTHTTIMIDHVFRSGEESGSWLPNSSQTCAHTHTLHLSSVESFYVWILQPGCSGHWTLNKVQEVKVYLFVLYFYTIFSLLAGLPTQKPSALLLPFHSAHLWKSWLCAWHLNWFSGLQVCRNPRAIKVNASN